MELKTNLTAIWFLEVWNGVVCWFDGMFLETVWLILETLVRTKIYFYIFIQWKKFFAIYKLFILTSGAFIFNTLFVSSSLEEFSRTEKMAKIAVNSSIRNSNFPAKRTAVAPPGRWDWKNKQKKFLICQHY